MAGAASSGSALVGPLVRIVTGNVVSSMSMVSRAFLRDSWLGVLIEATDGSHWLAATHDALVPEPEGLIVRGAANGGPPVEHGSPRLVNVRLAWGSIAGGEVSGGEAEVANPVVVKHPGGVSVAVIRLAKARPLLEAVVAGTGPTPFRLSDGFGTVGPTRTVDVLTLLEDDTQLHWPVVCQADVVSEDGFFGEPGAVALRLEVQESESGAPAFVESRLCGLVRPLAPGLSLLVPAEAIAETIAHAQS